MTADTRAADTLRKNALGAPHIVFFVIAAAAPLTAVVGVTPAAFQLGNGPGVPVTSFSSAVFTCCLPPASLR
jgi:hypothetical protein